MTAPVAENLNIYTQLFKLISDETRLKIVLFLYEEELCVCNLMDLLQVSQPSVSQHLRKLRDADVIKVRNQGQWKYYSINTSYTNHHLLLKLIDDMPSLKNEIDALKQADGGFSCNV